MNNYVQVKLPDPYVQVKSNDNALTVAGRTADGYVSKSILKDDPDAESELNDLVQAMSDHQRAQLTEQCGAESLAVEDFDDQMQDLQDEIDTYFNTNS